MSVQHISPIRHYLALFGSLMFLTGITTWVAYQDLGSWNTPVAMAIAGFKVLLVVLFFMHVKYSGRLIMIFVLAGVYWLLILFAFLMSDYMTRGTVSGWPDGIL
jgi:cytochrome c oxidase subunit 4